MFSCFHLMHVAVFSTIRPAMVSKWSELTKRQARDRYGRLASPASCIVPPPSRRQEVGSSSRRHTTPSPSSDDSSAEMWEVTPPPRPPRATTMSALTSER
jgi:hypothetical protein